MSSHDDTDIGAIGVSGRHWIGFDEKPTFDLVVETLSNATKYIRIATYSLGEKSNELEKLFDILRAKSMTGVKVQLIINNFEKASPYAKKRLKQIESTSDNFVILNFKPRNKNENLHAKIISVDKKHVLIGSANMSRSGMFSNHEIMVKISGGKFASKVDGLLDKLAESIFSGDK